MYPQTGTALHPAFLTIILFSIIPRRQHQKWKFYPYPLFKLQKPSEEPYGFNDKPGYSNVQKAKFWAGNSISFVHTWYSGETMNCCKGCWKKFNSWGTQGTLLLLVLQHVFAVLQHRILVPAGRYRNSVMEVPFAEVKCGMIPSQKQNWCLHARHASRCLLLNPETSSLLLYMQLSYSSKHVSSSTTAHSYKICDLCTSQQHCAKDHLPIFSSSPSSPLC